MWRRQAIDKMMIMKQIKENWKLLLFVLISGLIGGYCIGLYFPAMMTEEMTKQMQEQNITTDQLALITMIQYGIIYGVALAAIGVGISKKVKLWKEFRYDKEAVVATSIITIISAFLLYPGDKLIFGSFNSWVNGLYNETPSLPKIISGLFAGGVIEEVMLRLFMMSLIVLVISKIFCKDRENIPVKIYVIANVMSAILFAAGHIPSTMEMTTLTPLIIFRCFLFNGGIGLCFGYLYRKYGIGYAMISHGLCHLISDTLMVIFI